MRTTNAQQPFTAPAAVLMPNSVPADSKKSFQSVHNDFIPHPERFPLSYRRTSIWRRHFGPVADDDTGDIGLSFRSSKHIAIGTDMEISIPLRGDIQEFRGTVVLVREIADGYEIGLWLATENDASRARIVEQICHIECYLNDKRQRQSGGMMPDHHDRTWPDESLHLLTS